MIIGMYNPDDHFQNYFLSWLDFLNNFGTRWFKVYYVYCIACNEKSVLTASPNKSRKLLLERNQLYFWNSFEKRGLMRVALAGHAYAIVYRNFSLIFIVDIILRVFTLELHYF